MKQGGSNRTCIDGATRRRMRAWYRRAPGSLLLASERAVLARLLPYVFGYHIVQVGSLGRDRDYMGESRIRHRVIVDTECEPVAGCTPLRAQADELPFASDSVDAVILAHSLELESDPHAVLREAERILIPEGHLVVMGFNPWSLWGLWRLFLHRGDRVPWCARFVGAQRVRDWLALLGCDVVHERGHFYRPPLKYERLMGRLGFLERAGERAWPILSGGYVIMARKRVMTLTRIRPRWRRRKVVLTGLAEPTARGYHRRG